MAASVEVRLDDEVTDPADSAVNAIFGLVKAMAGLKNAGVDASGALFKVASSTERVSASAAKFNANVAKANKQTIRRGQLNKQLISSDSKLREGLEGIADAGSDAGESGAMLAGVYGAIATAALAAASAVIRFAARVAFAFGKAVVGAALFLQKQQQALGLLLKSGTKGAAALKKVTTLAGELGLNVQKTTAQFKNLIAQQFKVDEALDVVRLAADMKVLGASAENVQSIVDKIAKIKSAGKFQTGDVADLAQQGISAKLVIQALAKQLNKTEDATRKLLAAGKVNADQGIAAVKQAIKNKFHIENLGDAAKKAGKGLEGMWNRFLAAGQLAILDIAEDVLPDLQKSIVPLIQDMVKAFKSPAGKKFVSDIGEGLARIVRIMGAVGKVLFAGFKGFFAGLSRGRGLIEGVGQATGELNAAQIAELARKAGELAGKIGEVLGKVLKLVDALERLKIDVPGGATGTGATGKLPAFDPAKLKAGGLKSGAALSSGLAAGITAGIPAAVAAAASLADQVKAAVASALKITSPSKVFENLGMNTARGFQIGMTGEGPRVAAASAGVVDPSSLAALGPGGGTTNLNADTNAQINVQGAGDPADVAIRVRDVLLDELAGTFEQLNIEVNG